ncbi:DUF1294 domain-containing protein [[Haemophilus] ducreyi]|nr:DUF1294 domain-containing protein [[Haemophilus] ducreyi]
MLVIYAVLINAVCFYLMYWDKRQAVKKMQRIAESNLLFLTAMGGFIGVFLAIKYLRHKSKKWYFHFTVSLAGLFWLLVLPILYYVLIFNHKNF